MTLDDQIKASFQTPLPPIGKADPLARWQRLVNLRLVSWRFVLAAIKRETDSNE